MKFAATLILLMIMLATGKTQSPLSAPFAHTFSIVAVDSATGEIGAAVQSHWFSVGTSVIWAEAGVGAVATQSFVNVSFGPRGLQLLRDGVPPREALDILLSDDDGREFRQVALIDARGNSVSYTGGKCIAEAGGQNGRYYSVQANMMLKNSVWDAMEKTFKNSQGPLAERLIAVLEAAQAEGGDIRGKQSAALLVVKPTSSGKVWEDRQIDLRVDDNPDPIKELKRLLHVYRAYQHMNAGDLAVEKGNETEALREYSMAEQMEPANLEMKYWHAVSLANTGRLQEALPIFAEIFRADSNWKILTPRLLPNGLLKVTDKQLKEIMDLR